MLQFRRWIVSHRLLRPLLAATAAAALFTPLSAVAQVFGGADRDEPLARFQDALCPGVTGIQLEQAQEIVGVIRANAQKLGLRLADPATCQPNVILAVMDDPQAFLKGLIADRPYLIEELDPGERQALLKQPGPALNWERVEVRTRDGLMVSRRLNLGDIPVTRMQMAHSKIYKATRRDIVSAMVMITPAAVQGLTVAQLADYTTMRALSDDDAAQLQSPHPTILHLFDSAADKPAGLTEADRIFLATLYSTQPNDPASITLAMANDRIAKVAGR